MENTENADSCNVSQSTKFPRVRFVSAVISYHIPTSLIRFPLLSNYSFQVGTACPPLPYDPNRCRYSRLIPNFRSRIRGTIPANTNTLVRMTAQCWICNTFKLYVVQLDAIIASNKNP